MAQAKFLVIKQFITKQIESRLWAENTRVPSENELAGRFKVSRMTARRALQDLTDEGVLTRTQGLGTFVASLKSQSSIMEIRNIADEIADRGRDHSCIVVGLATVKADESIAIALELKPGDSVYYSQLIHCENQIPLQLEDRYVNPKLIPEYVKQDFTTITPHAYLSQIAPLTEARHTIEAVSPTDSQCRLLKLAASEPCLQITRRTFSANGVVSYARLTSPGSRYRLDSQLTF